MTDRIESNHKTSSGAVSDSDMLDTLRARSNSISSNSIAAARADAEAILEACADELNQALTTGINKEKIK